MRYNEFHADVLGGARVLIVEDNFLIAADLDLMVEDAGGQTAALLGSAEQALHFLAQEAVDAVILEVKLRDGDADPLVHALTRRGIPFVIYTGAPPASDAQWRRLDAKTIEKPALPHVLVDALESALKERCLQAA
jgi:DNA-binding NtrC family response regulator